MLRYIFVCTIFFFIFLFSSSLSFADSAYVLPYPSAMPGSRFYALFEIKDRISQIFYFGDFGSFKYNLSQSDKYLVESKTLFEYSQYLLAEESLKKSDSYFLKITPGLISASNNGKVVSEKQNVLDNASLKHIEVLEKLKTELPSRFDWNPEKGQAKTIDIEKLIEESIKVRKAVYD